MTTYKLSSGGYQARWRDADGKQRARRFGLKKDADSFLATVSVDTARGTYIAPDAGRESVKDYARRWAAGQPWRESSRDRMTHVIESQIMPTFGAVKLRGVRVSAVQAWVGKMTSDGLAPSTVESYFRVLAAVMRAAKRDKLIHESPCDGTACREPRAQRPLWCL